MSSQPDQAPQPSRAIIARLRGSLPRPSLPWRDSTRGPQQTRVIALGTLGIRTSRVGNTCSLRLSGQLNQKTSQSLNEVLAQSLEHDTHATVLDLSYLVLIDYAGVHTILTVYLPTTNQRNQSVMIPAPPAVQRVIDAIRGPLRYTTRAPSFDRPRSGPGKDRPRSGPGKARNTEPHDRIRIKSTTRLPRRGQSEVSR